MNTNQMRKAKSVYSELAGERESATITCVWAETWENFLVKKGRFQAGKP